MVALRASLEHLHWENSPSLMYNAIYDLAFVEHPEPYAFWNNSDHVVARWLERLGCVIEGSASWAWWRVGVPEETGAQRADDGI